MKVRLTKKSVEAIPLPAKGETTVWDSDLSGFVVRVKPGGRRIYYVYYRTVAGTRVKRWLKLGVHGTVTAEQARASAVQYLAAAARGEDPFADRKAAKKGLPLSEFWQRYEKNASENWKDSTKTENARMWKIVLAPTFGDMELEQVGRAHIIAFKEANRHRRMTANRAMSLLKAIFNAAIEWEAFVGENPVAKVKFYPEKARETFLGPHQLRAILQAIDEEEALGAKGKKALDREGESTGQGGRGKKEIESRGITASSASLFRLLIFTGARRGEIMHAEWSWVDLDRGSLSLPDEASKTGKKVVWLPAPAIEELQEMRERRTQARWLIEGEKPGEHLVNAAKPWERVRERSAAILRKKIEEARRVKQEEGRGEEIEESADALESVRMHDLRHSFASFAIGTGIPLQVIGKTLGHAQARTTERYAHLADDPVRDAARLIGERIRAIAEDREAKVVPVPVEKEAAK